MLRPRVEESYCGRRVILWSISVVLLKVVCVVRAARYVPEPVCTKASVCVLFPDDAEILINRDVMVEEGWRPRRSLRLIYYLEADILTASEEQKNTLLPYSPVSTIPL